MAFYSQTYNSILMRLMKLKPVSYPPKKPVAAFFFVLHKVSISIVLNLWTLIGRGASQEIGAIFQDPAEQNSRGKGILLLPLITFSDITVY